MRVEGLKVVGVSTCTIRKEVKEEREIGVIMEVRVTVGEESEKENRSRSFGECESLHSLSTVMGRWNKHVRPEDGVT